LPRLVTIHVAAKIACYAVAFRFAAALLTFGCPGSFGTLVSKVISFWTGAAFGAGAGVGLDPQIGYLHVLRPGRPALGLDLLEEFRAPVADRLALSLVNRRQIARGDFDEQAGGAVYLSDTGRKTVIVAYQERKKEEFAHPFLHRKVPVGLLPHVQAQLLARHLRGDLTDYPAFVVR
jgi:CRISP-associated protein Cas1